MATLPKGVNLQKHFNKVLNDWGVNVTLNRINSATSNISGDLSDSYGEDETLKVIFLKRRQAFVFGREGLIEQGDAYILVKYSDVSSNPLERHDRITYNGEVFEVETSINRFDSFYYAVLYKVD